MGKKHSKPAIVIIGNICKDINRYPNRETQADGGAAYFAALAASRISGPIGLVSRIGKDYDSAFLFSHVLCDGVKICSDKPTMCSIQIYKSETDPTDRDIEQILGVGPDICAEDFPTTWYNDIRHVHIATMQPQQQRQFISLIREKMPQAKISLDTDLFLLKDEMIIREIKKNYQLVDMGFVNRREYELLHDVIDSLPHAVIKLDADGAFILKSGKKITEVSTPKVTVVDTTGAGDIFAGTYISSLENGMDEKTALEEAVQTASLSVTKPGISALF